MSYADQAAREGIRDAAIPLPDPDADGFAHPFDRFTDARLILLGESTHGSAEFYRARAAVTRHLIEHANVRTVAFEADWPDMAALDSWVRGGPALPGPDHFARFPTWMWRNAEFARFAAWVRRFNSGRPPAARVAFRGLDLYSMGASIAAVLRFLEGADPDAAADARRRYGCLTPYQDQPFAYGQEARRTGIGHCEDAVTTVLRDLLDQHLHQLRTDGEPWLDAVENARVVADAEAYYRAACHGGPESWNLRDRHMARTLDSVLAASGGRAVVWAHNSHVGDARATEMGWDGQLTLGQLCRETHGSAAVLIGFGTAHGSVMAAPGWDEAHAVVPVRRSLPGSWEDLCAESAPQAALLDLRQPELAESLAGRRLERAIGVVYRPQTERWSHYFEAELPRQFDGWVWFDRTGAIQPLPTPATPDHHGPDRAPDTWPTGL